VSCPASGASRGKIQAKNCFVCGYDNPRGLNIPFHYDGEKIMMHLIWASDHRAVTAEVTMRFHRHSEAGKEIQISASFESIGSHLIKAECILSDAEGRIATARGKFLPMSEKEKTFFRKKF
jgi:hypothetical protein